MRHGFLLIFVHLVDKNCRGRYRSRNKTGSVIVLLQWDKALPLGKSQGNHYLIHVAA